MTGKRTRLRRYAPVLPIAIFLLSCGIASLVLSSCRSGHQNGLGSGPGNALSFEGVPIVRVRLTSMPVKSTTIGTTGSWSLLADNRQVDNSTVAMKDTPISRNGDRWTLGDKTVRGQTLRIESRNNLILIRGNGRMYRGILLLLPDEKSGGSFYVHNHVDMENYLASVVACELLDSFKHQAFRAQAVAARTYAMYEMATRGQRGSFDVWDSQQSQVYKGAGVETENSRRAVSETSGWVMAYGPKGKEHIFMTQFSACNGGYVNGANVLRDVTNLIPPLRGGQKDDDQKICPSLDWKPVKVTKRALYNALASKYRDVNKLRSISSLRVKDKTAYGRPLWIEITGTAGKAIVIRAENVRLALLKAKVKLKSMNCKIRDLGNSVEFYDGHGYGHGVGLSQWGAEGKARRGMTGEDILDFYYPGAAIFRAY